MWSQLKHHGVALLPRLPLLSDFLKYLIMMLLQRLASHSAGIETEGWENLMSTSSHRQSELQHASSNALITKERSACNVERSQPYCSSYCQKSFIKYRRTQIQELPRSMWYPLLGYLNKCLNMIERLSVQSAWHDASFRFSTQMLHI